MANIHGDIVATVPNQTSGAGTSTSSYGETTEYGLVRSGFASLGRYGWLGVAQRSSDALSGLFLMGVRLYNPTTGQFLTRDPVSGGNENAYTYPNDPVNMSDVTGKLLGLTWKDAAMVAGVGAFVACVAASVGVCLVAGAGAALVQARADAKQWGGGTFWKSAARNTAINTGGALLGYGLGKAAIRGTQLGNSGLKFSRHGQVTNKMGRAYYRARGWNPKRSIRYSAHPGRYVVQTTAGAGYCAVTKTCPFTLKEVRSSFRAIPF